MRTFFKSLNMARAFILLPLLGSIVLLWMGWRHGAQFSELNRNLQVDMPKLAAQVVEVARSHTRLSDSLKGENLQGEADLGSYIYKVAGMDRVEAGNLDQNPTSDSFTKGVVDRKILIRPDNRERTFKRMTIAHFLYTLEQQSRRVKVTMIKIEAADKRLKPHEIPEDLWTFEAELTSRQRAE